MKKRNIIGLFAVILFLWVELGCYHPKTAKLDAGDNASPKSASFGIGDVLEVHVYGEESLNQTCRVDEDGKISLPILGEVVALNKTTSELTTIIRDKLADGYILKPQVKVTPKENNSKKVFIFGQVSRPGAYSYAEVSSVLNAIAVAGGFTKVASANQSQITRFVNNQEIRLTVKMKDIGRGIEPDIKLSPGDIIYVPESIF